jgi:hypothetical protein
MRILISGRAPETLAKRGSINHKTIGVVDRQSIRNAGADLR